MDGRRAPGILTSFPIIRPNGLTSFPIIKFDQVFAKGAVCQGGGRGG